MIWTIITTAFFWTTSMRLFYKPEISEWAVFGFSGKGFSGDFWFPIVVIIYSIILFYLEGRGRARGVFYVMLLIWHFALLFGTSISSIDSGSTITFGAWGINMAVVWLTIPFLFFFALTVWYVVKERSVIEHIETRQWNQINLKQTMWVIALVPVSYFFFCLGSGFNLLIKVAITINVIQWIMIAKALTGSSKIMSNYQ
ncbi:hypothetical protein [Penaeicola halotolerans]|jgi:hypothetical protein|uniref:hypothetical protein n=1 Tax=Penaeicola halotolerans TaxID=2793196 RepID=UPI001CF8B105|nr:hypothetical protein [Penaeicola halotolerans]